MPVMVASMGGPWSSTFTRSPTWKWYFEAVAASTTIWPGPRGGEPSRSRSGFRVESSSQVTPSVGAPPVVMAFPSLSTS